MPIRVIIIGAGTAGLCLAHGLKGSGVDVVVHERDRSPNDRLQGYRLHISVEGTNALRDCLPPERFKQFISGAAKPNTAVTFLDSDLRTLLRIPVGKQWPDEPTEIPISRITLRKVLLSGLDGIVEFDKRFTSFELNNEKVVAHFEDGSTAVGTFL
jgi:2-polyprenyl-6-methoxyphenol hydroxylase-like FAD-dependent oxidoreductase